MAPKNIMKEFTIAEISGVDDPAQAPALMTLMKSRTSSSTADEFGKHKEGTMPKTPEELAAELTKSAKDLEVANKANDVMKARLDFLEAYAKMSADEKTAADSMTEEEKAKFVAASAEERKSLMAKSAEANPIVYKSKSGDVFRKNDDPRLVAMAKRDDDREAEMAKMREDAADAAFEKRATTELAKFKGTLSTKTALVKAIAGIKDEAVRKSVEEMVKSAHSAMSVMLKEAGTMAEDTTGDDDDEGNGDIRKSAETQLDKLAKAEMAKSNVTFAKAYQTVLGTSEGARLYAQASA